MEPNKTESPATNDAQDRQYREARELRTTTGVLRAFARGLYAGETDGTYGASIRGRGGFRHLLGLNPSVGETVRLTVTRWNGKGALQALWSGDVRFKPNERPAVQLDRALWVGPDGMGPLGARIARETNRPFPTGPVVDDGESAGEEGDVIAL